MPPIEVLVAFTFAALLMNLSPGPSNLYVIARAIAQGTRGGVVAALGLAAGSLLHVVAAVFGLSAVFQHSPALYTAVKLFGAAYLLYLGYSYWRASSLQSASSVEPLKRKSLSAVFVESVVVEASNPKTALFFIALLPQFVVPEAGPVSQQLLLLGVIVTVSALPCDILVAVSSSRVAAWLLQNPRAQQIQERVSGSLLMAMGAYIVADELVLGDG